MANFWHLVFFFIVALILLLSATYLLSKALKSKNAAEDLGSLNVYKSQLDLINAEFSAGNISKDDYDAAKIEIGKRLNILKSIEQKKASTLSPKSSFILIILFGFLSIGTYFLMGSPFYADQSFSKRSLELSKSNLEELSNEEIMVLLQDRIAKDQKDFMPHLLMAKVFISEEKNEDALRALKASLKRNDKSAETYAEIAGTLFNLNGGNIDTEASNAINIALKLEPENLSANFYNAKFLWRTGKKQEALKLWETAFKNKNIDRQSLIGKILDELSRLDIDKNNVKALSENMDMQKGGAPFIDGMIAQRTAKLAASPNDIGLILSLARVKIMTGKTKEALEILENGKQKFSSNSFEWVLMDYALNSVSGIEK